MTNDECWMLEALKEAQAASAEDEVPVGAVVVVFGAFDKSCGCTGSRVDLTDHWFYHSVETWGGILERNGAALLTEFFQRKR